MADGEQFEQLARRLIAAVPKLDPEAQRIGLALIRTLAAGRPVTDREVALAAGASESDARDALGCWPGVFRDGDGLVVGFMGLSVVEFGERRIEVDGRRSDGVVCVGHAVPAGVARPRGAGVLPLPGHG